MSSLHPCQSISMSCVYMRNEITVWYCLAWSWGTDWQEWIIIMFFLLIVLLAVLLFHLCLSLRLYLDSRQCVGGDGERAKVERGGGWPSSPTLKARQDQEAVIHWDREKPSSWKILGQHSPWSFLGGARQSTLQEWRGDSSNNGETILATTRYVNSWN